MAAPFLASLVGLAAMASARPEPATRGCEPDFLEHFDAGPVEPGPLRLASILCHEFGPDSSRADPIVSPDGSRVARWPDGTAPMEIAALGRPGLASLHNRVTFRNIAPLGDGLDTAPDALAWAADSRSLWGVRQQVAARGGWALGGLTPVSISRDGAIRDLPALHHPAGPLDGILWVGGHGLALAQFGTYGHRYRPEHEDIAPTLAMVDAARGRVLAALPAASVPELAARVRADAAMVWGATGAILRDGRIRVVMQVTRWDERPPGVPVDREPIVHPGFWLVWTQGEAPRLWPAPYPGDHHNPLALSPDGSTLLVARPLQPDGWRIDCRGGPCPGPRPPPPTPVSGPVAELIDVASRRVLWRVSARADRFWNRRSAPVISADGRYALIEVPPNSDRAPIALIDMRTGRIVQRIAPTHIWSSGPSFGFTNGGRRVWVDVGNVILVYEVRRR